MKEKFLHECSRFERCCDYPGLKPKRNIVGLKQFHEFESNGVAPTQPDPYYILLVEGKKWWEWTVNFIAESYGTLHWDGWMQIAFDYKEDMSGYRQIADRIGQREIAMEIFEQTRDNTNAQN